MSEALRDVTRTVRKHERSAAERRAAFRVAYLAGHSYAEIARAAGVSRQAVRELLTRADTNTRH